MDSSISELLEILVCPKCKGDLYIKDDKLICEKCKLGYKTDGRIAQLIIDNGELDEGT